MERYLSAHDAGRVLNVTAQAVHQMVRRGELVVAAETESRIRLFRRADVDALAQKRCEDRATRLVDATDTHPTQTEEASA